MAKYETFLVMEFLIQGIWDAQDLEEYLEDLYSKGFNYGWDARAVWPVL